MTLTPVEFAHLYLYGDKDKFQDPSTWFLGPSYGHYDTCKRLVALVEARDKEWTELLAFATTVTREQMTTIETLKAELATAIAQKRATDNENLQLRAQLDPDGRAQALTQVMGMQTFATKPGEAAREYGPCSVCGGRIGMPFCSACMGTRVEPK